MDASVLPRTLFKTFFRECNVIYGQLGYKAGFASLKDRAWSPLADHFSHFSTPYRRSSDFGWNFLAGPVAALGCVLVPYVSLTLLIIPAIGELLLSMSSFAKAMFHLCKGETEQASVFFRDGLTRFMLAPCLALLSVIAVPLEFIRFLVRCVSTFVHAIRSFFTRSAQLVEPIDHVVLGVPVDTDMHEVRECGDGQECSLSSV